MKNLRPLPIMIALLLGGVCGSLLAEDAGDPMQAYTDSLNLRRDASLVAVAFFDPEIGIACGEYGTILRTSDGGRSWSLTDSGVSCRLNDVLWLTARRAVIVGGSYDPITQINRGVVLQTADGGATWQRGNDAELPKLNDVKRTSGGLLVATGEWSHSLLTNRVESHNLGRVWDAAEVQDLPLAPLQTRERLEDWSRSSRFPVAIRDVCQISEQAICAVGDHGVIKRSSDGGKTWQVVRGDGRQTCVLVVAKEPSTVAWPLVGNEALENRNRTALLLTDPDIDASQLSLTRQAMSMLGGASVDSFDCVSQTDEASCLAAASDWMRIHRPRVLVIDNQIPHLLQDILLTAATQVGVPRVVHYSTTGGGNNTLHRDALLPRVGVLASDLQLDAMQLIAPARAEASSISIRFVYDLTSTNRRSDALTSGLSLQPGHRLDAPPATASRRRLQMAQARMQQVRRVDEFVSQSSSVDRFKANLIGILDQTSKEDQFRVAWNTLLKTKSRFQDKEFQRVVLLELYQRFPNRSGASWAQLRAESLTFSRERSRLRLRPNESITRTPASSTAVPVSPFQIPQNEVRQASAVLPLLVPNQQPKKVLTGDAEEVETAIVDLSWEFHPLLLLGRDASRQRGDEGVLQPADGPSADLARLADVPSEPWSQLIYARSRVIRVPKVTLPPRLDGVLNDHCWQSALPLAGSASQLQFAYDDEYLYVAIRFDASDWNEDLTRPDGKIRDHNLEGVDRLRLRLDTDRDLMTSMQLQLSAAGRTHDAIDGNPDWQPAWYVDTKQAGRQVIVELALSRYDIADLPIPAGETWYASVDLIPAGTKTCDPIIPNPETWKRIVFQP